MQHVEYVSKWKDKANPRIALLLEKLKEQFEL